MHTYVAAEVVLKIVRGVEAATDNPEDLVRLLAEFGVNVSAEDAAHALEAAKIVRQFNDDVLDVWDIDGFEFWEGPEFRRRQILDTYAGESQDFLITWSNKIGRVAA